MAVQLERRLWTVKEYHTLSEAGVLHEDDRVELIEGELLTMSPVGIRHIACVNKLTNLFATRLEGRAIISTQNPVQLDEHSEPEPDIVLLKYHEHYYFDQGATVEDVLLCVEVSDSTIAYDRRVKRPLYARAGIREYWLVNLVDNVIEVYRRPEGDDYQETFRRYNQDTISVAFFENVNFRVAELIG